MVSQLQKHNPYYVTVPKQFQNLAYIPSTTRRATLTCSLVNSGAIVVLSAVVVPRAAAVVGIFGWTEDRLVVPADRFVDAALASLCTLR